MRFSPAAASQLYTQERQRKGPLRDGRVFQIEVDPYRAGINTTPEPKDFSLQANLWQMAVRTHHCPSFPTLARRLYDRMIGLELDDVAVDGCITKAPSGGETAGRSPVDRGKQGLQRSTVTDATGVPLHLVATGANRHDSPLLGPTLS